MLSNEDCSVRFSTQLAQSTLPRRADRYNSVAATQFGLAAVQPCASGRLAAIEPSEQSATEISLSSTPNIPSRRCGRGYLSGTIRFGTCACLDFGAPPHATKMDSMYAERSYPQAIAYVELSGHKSGRGPFRNSSTSGLTCASIVSVSAGPLVTQACCMRWRGNQGLEVGDPAIHPCVHATSCSCSSFSSFIYRFTHDYGPDQAERRCAS